MLKITLATLGVGGRECKGARILIGGQWAKGLWELWGGGTAST